MKDATVILLCLITFVAINSTKSQTQTTCATFSSTRTAEDPLEPADTTEHSTGRHAWGLTPVSKCTYTSNNTRYCGTACTVKSLGATVENPLGSTINIETGSLNVAGTHQVNGNWLPGIATATSAGASCTGYLGAGATNCFTVPFTNTCFVSVSVSTNGVTVSTNGHEVWKGGPAAAANTCERMTDPEYTMPGPSEPGSAPDACNDLNPMMTYYEYQSLSDQCIASGNRYWNDTTCSCEQPCPVVIDTAGSGFDFTDYTTGVAFDINGDGTLEQISWTAANVQNAFLVLDRNHNGRIDSGKELFGNYTPQTGNRPRNGFAALAEFDQPGNGGNDDGKIDAQDMIYASLRLWHDFDHNGLATPNELSSLESLGVSAIHLDFREDRRQDKYGNEFRYRSKVTIRSKEKWAYDVFLIGH